MHIYKLLRVVTLFCVINEGFAKVDKAANIDEPSSGDTSRESNGGSSSGRRGSGWWGGGRNRSSKPASQPNPRPKSNPKSGDSGKRNSGWWGGRNRNVQTKPKPQPRPVPKKNPEPKPKSKGSGWWSSKNRNVPPKPKPKPNPVPKRPQSSKPKPAQKPKQNTKPKTDIKKVIEGFEDVILKAYDAQPKDPKVHDTTIGIGFNLNRPDAEKTFKKQVPGVDFNKVKSGKQTITEAQARALFNHDVDKIYEPRARNKVGKDVYDKLPSNVKAAVVNAVFRGDLGPKATDLIKKGKWNEVGKEYLDHEEYRNAKKLGKSGVKTRMDWNKKQFDTMVKP